MSTLGCMESDIIVMFISVLSTAFIVYEKAGLLPALRML